MKLLTGPVLAAFLVCGPTPQTPGVAAIVLTPQMLCIDVDEQQQITATAVGFDGQAIAATQLTWAVADTSVATITQDGKVKGVAVGQTKVTASSGTAMSNEVTVNVPKACSVTTKERWHVRGKITQTRTSTSLMETLVSEGEALVEGERFSNQTMLVMTAKPGSGSVTHTKNATVGNCTDKAELTGTVATQMDCAIFFTPQENDAFNVVTIGECTSAVSGTETRTCPVNEGGTSSFMSNPRVAWLFIPHTPKFVKTATSLSFSDQHTETIGAGTGEVTVTTYEWSFIKQP